MYGRPLGDASSASGYIDSRKIFKSLKPLALLSYRLSVSKTVAVTVTVIVTYLAMFATVTRKYFARKARI